MIQSERIEALNDSPVRENGAYILYWMQASQRESYNYALEFSIELANLHSLPLLVVFGIMDDYPEANERHYAFMVEGLRETAEHITERGATFRLYHGSPETVAISMSAKAATVVTDMGYLRHQKAWRGKLSKEAGCKVWQVETDAVVPIRYASDKDEYAARTLRPKIHRHLKRFLVPLERREILIRDFTEEIPDGLDVSDPALLSRLKLDRSVPPVPKLKGGPEEARTKLKEFIRRKLPHYAEDRNDPANDYTSGLSHYLHFGQISPLQIALNVGTSDTGEENIEAFLEELIVRRELAFNFTYFNARYDEYAALPEWAQKTLEKHRSDTREHLYSADELEAARTHDPYWNAAMTEMVRFGTMQGYMRMYWGKKILEWSEHPEEAFERTLMLNNKYFVDGRDPNSFTGVAWIYGKHDRPWTERPVFGTIRYMNANGLKRKFDIDQYVKNVMIEKLDMD